MTSNAQRIVNEMHSAEIKKLKKVIIKLANRLFGQVLSVSEIKEIEKELK